MSRTEPKLPTIRAMAEVIDPMAWIAMTHHIDTPRYGKRRERAIERAKAVLFFLARREPEWKGRLLEMLLGKDGDRPKLVDDELFRAVERFAIVEGYSTAAEPHHDQ